MVSLWFVLVLPFLSALLALILSAWEKRRSVYAFVSAGSFALALIASLPHLKSLAEGKINSEVLPWIPSLGINLSLRMDGLGSMFAVLILGIGVLIAIYANGYLHSDDPPARFFGSLSLFGGAMVGVVLADDLIALCVFWELTTISSFLLIGYWFQRERARYGAYQSLVVTALGGLALLAGVLMLGIVAGSFEWSQILRESEKVKANYWFTPALLLILVGAFTKSAQFPFHFWLPNAMEAPTPVSAYLHSATMVKAGVFLLAKFHPLFHDHQLWQPLVSGFGLLTMLWAGYVALHQRDMKALLAYSTVSQLGFMTFLLGLGTEEAAASAILVLLTHAVFKAALFLSAGIVEHETHTRQLDELGGLAKEMPITATFAVIAAFASAGLPPLNGFLGKESAFESVYHFAKETHSLLLLVLLTVASIFTAAYSYRFAWEVFFKKPPKPYTSANEPKEFLRFPVILLGSLCLLMGLVSSWFVQPLFSVGVSTITETAPKVKLWHGFGVPFVMSLIGILGGALVMVVRKKLTSFHLKLPQWNGDKSYDLLTKGLLSFAELLTDTLQSGSLRRYLWVTVLFVLFGTVPLLAQGGWFRFPKIQPVSPSVMFLGAILVLAALLTAIFHTKRLLAVLSLSVVGVMVIAHFILLSAPDLALTQLVVEVASLLLFLGVLVFLPKEVADREPVKVKWQDGALALLVGFGITVLLMAIFALPFETVSRYYYATAKELAGGKNVVNVIVVDYRGYDTLGEITVMGIAGLGIYALIRLRRRKLTESKSDDKEAVYVDLPPEHWTLGAQGKGSTPLIMTVARILLIPGLLAGLYLFWRGHNAPGGGFIAGLVVAALIGLQYIAFGENRVRRAMRVNYRVLIALGLLSALLTGSGSFLLGFPFLTSGYRYWHLPILGEIEIPSAMFFDLGVLFVVVGVVLLLLSLLGESARLEARETQELKAGEEAKAR
ncbi:MAG: DUF4040 domain-containing protein [Armatimonadetes bacterium]|nr:DUF4040 domain-containing protein [Armatimonadota bacterium]MDW8029137.1 proton-conducting transporter membrane subunit [Armatimonadota bacterium]